MRYLFSGDLCVLHIFSEAITELHCIYLRAVLTSYALHFDFTDNKPMDLDAFLIHEHLKW